MRVFGDLARFAVDAHRVVADARPRLRPALRLERRGGARVRRRVRVPRLRDVARALGVPDRPGRYGPRCMAVRDRRGARLRRAAWSRAGFVALAAALYLVAARARDVAGGRAVCTQLPRRRRVRPSARRRRATTCRRAGTLWLFGHQLEHGRRALARPVQLPARAVAARQLPGARPSACRTGRSSRCSAPCSRGTSSRC